MALIFTTSASASTTTASSPGMGLMYGNSTSCDRAPPRYGKSIPYHLVSTRLSSSTTNTESPTKNIKYGKEHVVIQQSIASSKEKKNRDDCPLCKKYSSGPCGSLFTTWMQCVDSNEGQESKCDGLIAPLSKCLEENKSFYDKISVYEEDQNVDDDSIEKWKDFVHDVENEIGSGDDIKMKQFDQGVEPEMQVRLKTQMGAVMFHPKIDDRVLLLAYVKDQDGNLLGAGSVDDLFDFQDQLVLRFSTMDTSRDITAHGLYGHADIDDNDGRDAIIYRKTERIPPP